MNKYINNLEEVKGKSTKIQLKTVNEVKKLIQKGEALLTESKQEISNIKEVGEKHFKLLDKFDTIDAKIHDLEQDRNDLEEQIETVQGKLGSVHSDGVEYVNVSEDTSDELLENAERLQLGAKNLGIDVPDEVKQAEKLANELYAISRKLDEALSKYQDF
jgi:chromosome segregation ATPase